MIGSTRLTKAEKLGCVNEILEMREKGMTCEEISKELEKEHILISREGIRTQLKKSNTIAKELAKTREETASLIDAIRDNPNSDVNEATIDFLTMKLFDFSKTIQKLEFDDPAQLITLIEKLTRSKERVVEQRMKYSTMYKRCMDDFTEALRKLIYDTEPELFERLYEMIKKMDIPEE